MKQNNSVVTLAVLGALALGALFGVLLPADNAAHAAAPELPATIPGLNVPEDTPPGVNIGDPISATDSDGDTLAYTLEGADAALVDIDPSTGQLVTKAPLDYEGLVDKTLNLTVKATDPSGSDDTVSVTINVTDVDEPPSAPAAPIVTSGSDTTSLFVIWYAPDDTGRDQNTDGYDVQHKKSTEAFTATNVPQSVSDTTASISVLEASTSYQVRVRAKYGSVTGPWSLSGTGNTNTADNSAPTFPGPATNRSVPENTPVGQNVGAAVTATDPDGGLLVHSLAGPDADAFDIDPGNGQLTTNAALDADAKSMYADAKSMYSVTVKVGDGDGGSDAIKVEISVDDVDEPPSKPDAPTVTATEDLSTSLDVSWTEPANMGPPITTYDVQYRAGTTGNFTNGPQNVAGTSDKIATNLTAGTSYQVRVRGTNAEGDSPWSNVGTGQTSPANNDPVFSTATTMRSVPENTQAGQPVGAAVSATTDPDGDALTYSLDGTNKDSFDIVPATGQIRTKSPLDHEGKSSYTVTVGVSDGLNDHRVQEETATTDSMITVTIEVTDVDEPPTKPYAPTVISGSDTTSLVVSWDAPDVTGRPAIDDYDVQYRAGGGFVSNNVTVTNTGATITGLDADTSYQVQVRATSDEGTGPWSDSGAGSTNADGNAAPTLPAPSPTPSVPENTSTGQNVGAVIAANDTDGGTLSYSLGKGVDEDSFTIVLDSGQIQTKSPLDHEGVSSYTVTVKVEDGQGGSATTEVTITVTDEDEPPTKPDAPTVTATDDSSTSLDVSWNAPANTGPDITEYGVQYREGSSGTFTDWAHGSTGTTATINTGLTADTTYEVRVRAKNGESDATENWSDPGSGTTGTVNNRPVFSSGATAQRSVAENTRAEQPAGGPVAATDSDSNTLTYSLDGVHEALFGFDTGTGQIRTKTPLDYESRSSYSLTVKVDDGTGRSNSSAAISVTITVTDTDETPSAPDRPTVMATGSTTNVRVTWDQPANMGPAIIYYEVQYRVGSSEPKSWPHNSLDTTTIITGLSAGTSYQVQVRAGNEDGQGGWSVSGTGSPSVDVANTAPVFSAETATWSVDENTAAGIDIASPVRATDADRDLLTYTLEGTDAASFAIVATSGQIRTREPLNHEEKTDYSVTVKADDRRGGSDTIAVTIMVTDVDGEAPEAPDAPTVTETVGSSTSLDVSWDAPENMGPEITDYDYRYKATLGVVNWTEVTNTTITDTAVTIPSLTAETPYDVQVRATNDEGTGDWSDSGTGATSPNSAPVFDAERTTRTVSQRAGPDTAIGDPVTATDANGDTLTYSLEGAEADSFDIDGSTGQLTTKAGVVLDADTKSTYTFTVVASDGTARDTITVTITVVRNIAPVFASTRTTRSVRENTPSGRSIGAPVTATDADTGDTLTYTLGGTDAASFTIVAATGQIRTRAELDRETKSRYTVTVTANDGTTDSEPITVTITVTFSCTTGGAVADADNNPGLVSDCEALLDARDRLEGDARILNWSEVNPITEWDGIYLGGTTPRVTRVIRRDRGLSGTVPAELGDLSMLRELNLRTNRLTGEIPAALGDLRNLEKLLLHDNMLTGPIPNLRDLRSLEMLWLSGRDMALTGGVPSWFNSMSSLESVSLWGNSLGGPIPRLTGMTSLNLIKLQSNGFTGNVPAWFADMDSLRTLYLHDNNLNGGIPAAFGQHTRLLRLWLDRNNLTGSIPAALGDMTSLRTLNLRDNQLSGSIPSALGDLSNLQHLRLHNNQLTGSIPAELGDMSSLRQLWVSNNRLSGSIPSALGDLSNLKELNLHTNQLSGAIPSELGGLSNLTRLRIGGVDRNRGNTGLTGCVPTALRDATDAEDLALAGSNGIRVCGSN